MVRRTASSTPTANLETSTGRLHRSTTPFRNYRLSLGMVDPAAMHLVIANAAGDAEEEEVEEGLSTEWACEQSI